MRAIVTETPGGWDFTRVAETAAPTPTSDQVFVAIKAASLNPADYFQIEGKYPGGPKPPFVPGRDAAGEVLQGDSQGIWKPGDKVVVLQSAARDLRMGTFAERQVFPANVLAPLPVGWTFAEGAAAPLVYLTAWRALVTLGEVRAGHTVLVTGAAGGVGLAAVQLAHGLGAEVVALSRDEHKRQRLLGFGARAAFAPDDPGLKDAVFAVVQRKGVHLVVENVGGPFLATSVHLLGKSGKVTVVGLLAGVDAPIPLASLLFKEATIRGVLVSEYTADEAASAWTDIVYTLGAKGHKPQVANTFALDDFRAAFTCLQASPMGKVVLTIT